MTGAWTLELPAEDLMDARRPTTSLLRPRGLDSAALAASVHGHLIYDQALKPADASRQELYQAVARSIRDRLMDRWVATERHYEATNTRRVCYLSMEFLLGRLLRQNVQALAQEAQLGGALEEWGATIEQIEEEESASGLGSGGLGRLAACFLDSMATLELPAYGYGLRYRFGLFRQRLADGWQTEEPDDWLRWGNPWEVARPDEAVRVSFYGDVTARHDDEGRVHYVWEGSEDVLAVPYDVPVPGFGTSTVNTLRLWRAMPLGSGLRLDVFHRGEFGEASAEQVRADTITSVLYPAERTEAGQELRLRQQYFLASATIQDLLRRHLRVNPSPTNLSEKLIVQLNDTHPAIAVPELQRLLMDEHGFGWDQAWAVTSRTFAYTNHTLLPEALETWPFPLLARLLPRHVQIIQEIDRRFLDTVRHRFPGDEPRIGRMAVIGRDPDRRVRMAHLSVAASRSVNGVAELHTRLLREGVLRDFADLYPERFNCKTNGITPRRWLLQANPRLASLVSSTIGRAWIRDLDALRELEPFAEDAEFRAAFRDVKLANKRDLADYVLDAAGVEVDPASLFDVQIKRIHEYKRQLLLCLYAIDAYLELLADPASLVAPRTILFAGKAAADYATAKLVIKLITSVARTINGDPEVAGRLRIVFLPNYSVSLAQRMVVAADVSEQISTAGYEASGTGNMKLTLNGALTLGTLDGANVEIQEEVGPENIHIFGLTADEVRARKEAGCRPSELYEEDPRLRRAIDAIDGHLFCPQPGLFHPLVRGLLDRDEYMVLADFRAYLEAQQAIARAYVDREEWSRRAILNVARVGKFSSDRTIRQYAEEVWNVDPLPVPPEE